MAESVYKIIELVGTSTTSWEKAAAAAVKRASESLRGLRIAEVSQLDIALEDGKPAAYRARVRVSFKFDASESSGARSPSGAATEAAAPAKAKAKARAKSAPKAAPSATAAVEVAAPTKKAPKKKAARKKKAR
jgi:hypothetical protein